MKKHIILPLCTVLVIAPSLAMACSFTQIGSAADYSGGQNFDFPPQVSAGIVVNKRHVQKTDGSFTGAPSAPPAQWVSKYGSVTFGFGRENPVTGVNEVGLRVYRFLFSQGSYPSSTQKPAIDESQFVQYLLDTAQSVDEVIQQTNAVQIYAESYPTHFAACDQSAQCVFIEAMNGKLQIFSGTEAAVNAMTNTDYATSLKVLKKCPSGNCNLKDNSEERFVKAAAQVLSFSGSDVVTGNFAILDSVKQSSPEATTLWTLLSHHTASQEVYYVKNTQSSNTVLTLDLKKLDFSCTTPVQVATLDPSDSRAVTLSDYTQAFQKNLSEIVHQYLGVTAADMQKRIDYPTKLTSCLD